MRTRTARASRSNESSYGWRCAADFVTFHRVGEGIKLILNLFYSRAIHRYHNKNIYSYVYHSISLFLCGPENQTENNNIVFCHRLTRILFFLFAPFVRSPNVFNRRNEIENTGLGSFESS